MRESPTLGALLLAVALLVALAASEAGFSATTWYPAALFLLALLALSVAVLGVPKNVPRPVVVALALLAAYTLWTYLSITWAGQPAAAWDGANRTAMYLILLALFALWPLRARSATVLLAAFGLGIAGLGLVELLRANGSSNPAGYFIGARLAEPAGYINANVALWTLGMFPCLFLASRRELAAPLRGLLLGGAGLLASLALMGQSRGWALTVPLAVVLYLVLVPGRLRAALAILAVAAGAAAVAGPVLAVHDELRAGRLDALLADATGAILVMTAALAVLGTAAAYADRRISPAGQRVPRGVARALAVAAVGALAGAAAVAVAAGGPERIGDAWDEFKQGGEQPGVGASRFSTGGTNRYDFWTVAWEAFRDSPVRGLGVENFQEEYLRHGNSAEQPRYPHSLELGVLSQTGVVGALLLAGALAAALAAAARARRSPPAERAVAAAAVAVFGYWLLHASVDWFWEFPALTGSAFALLGMATALAPRAERPGRARLGPAAVAVGALAVVALVASLGAPWLAERELSRASEIWPRDPDTAFAALRRAADLNPLSARPQLTEGTIALRMGDTRRAERAFLAALEREQANGYALLELGLIASERGDRVRAERLLARASLLSPRDEAIRAALEDVRAGGTVDLEAFNRRLLRRALSHGTDDLR